MSGRRQALGGRGGVGRLEPDQACPDQPRLDAKHGELDPDLVSGGREGGLGNDLPRRLEQEPARAAKPPPRTTTSGLKMFT